MQSYDAIIVGASVAGAVCALTLADKGWKVAVLEKRANPEHYKTICTHIIHPSGVKTLERLGLYPELDQASALATAMELNYEHYQAYYPFHGHRKAANIERSDLDPALKDRLISHKNVELLAGFRLEQIDSKSGKIENIVAVNRENSRLNLSCALLIGADGRNSDTVKLAGGSLKQDKNRRVALFAYFEKNSDTSKESSLSRVWSLKKGDEYIGYFPNREHDLVSWYISEEEYESVKNNKAEAFATVLEKLRSKGITLGSMFKEPAVAKQTAPMRGRTNLRNLALVGDAKLAADPLTGVGCSWAMSSSLLLCKCLPNKPPSAEQNKKQLLDLQYHVALYNLFHNIKYRIPSAAMTFMSLHGKWVFNDLLFPLVMKLTAKKLSSRNLDTKITR